MPNNIVQNAYSFYWELTDISMWKALALKVSVIYCCYRELLIYPRKITFFDLKTKKKLLGWDYNPRHRISKQML